MKNTKETEHTFHFKNIKIVSIWNYKKIRQFRIEIVQKGQAAVNNRNKYTKLGRACKFLTDSSQNNKEQNNLRQLL